MYYAHNGPQKMGTQCRLGWHPEENNWTRCRTRFVRGVKRTESRVGGECQAGKRQVSRRKSTPCVAQVSEAWKFWENASSSAKWICRNKEGRGKRWGQRDIQMQLTSLSCSLKTMKGYNYVMFWQFWQLFWQLLLSTCINIHIFTCYTHHYTYNSLSHILFSKFSPNWLSAQNSSRLPRTQQGIKANTVPVAADKLFMDNLELICLLAHSISTDKLLDQTTSNSQ